MTEAEFQLPAWVEYLSALSTPAIALFALMIGVIQWRTAHQRAVLDLFERRMEVYEAIRLPISEIVQLGSVSNEVTLAFVRSRDRVPFLFGPDVNEYLDSLYKLMLTHHEAEMTMQGAQGDERQKAIERKWEAFRSISEFYQRFPALISPYVKMHQKAPPF